MSPTVKYDNSGVAGYDSAAIRKGSLLVSLPELQTIVHRMASSTAATHHEVIQLGSRV